MKKVELPTKQSYLKVVAILKFLIISHDLLQHMDFSQLSVTLQSLFHLMFSSTEARQILLVYLHFPNSCGQHFTFWGKSFIINNNVKNKYF